MFSADKYVIEFVGNNWLSLGFVIGFFKILAKRSPSTLDDSIFTYLGESLSGFKRQKREEEPVTGWELHDRKKK